MHRQVNVIEKRRSFQAHSPTTQSSFAKRALILIVVVIIFFLGYQFYLHFSTPLPLFENITPDTKEDTKQNKQTSENNEASSETMPGTLSSIVEKADNMDEINLLEMQNPFERKFTPKTISYQVHSWDDLRLWHQGFKKGATYFKLDLFFVPAQVLDSFQQNPNNCHGKKGCFLLSHNVPNLSLEPNNPQFYYFTQHEFIAMLRDLKEDIIPKQKIMIALCFKYYRFNTIYQRRDRSVVNLGVRKNPCFPDVDEEWISLIDELYQQLVPIQQLWKEKYSIELEIVLDESGTPGGNNNPTGSRFGSRQCLLDRWPHWNYTYVSGRDPELAYTSNEAEPYNLHRYTYLNEPIFRDDPLKFIKKAQNKKFGKFRQQKNPMLVWEPSNQETIISVANQYLQSEEEDLPLGGLRFSINIDPINFEVFSSPLSQYGSNRRISGTYKLRDLKFVKITKDKLLLIHTNVDKKVYISLLKSYKTLSVENTTPLNIDTNKHGEIVSIVQTNQEQITLFTKKGLVSNINGFKKLNELFILTSNVFDVKQVGSKFYILEEHKSVVSLSIYIIEDNEFKRIEQYSIGEVDGFNLENATIVLSQSERGVIIFNTNKRIMYIMTWSVKNGELSITTPTPLSVGQKPQARIVTAQNKQLLVLLWQNGFCYNADLHNLQEQPLLCNLRGKSCSNVLNYMIIEFKLLEKVLSSQLSFSDLEFNEKFYPWIGKYYPPKPYFFIANPCSPYAIMGTYDRGSNPYFDVIEVSKKSKESQAYEDPYLRILEIHRGVSPVGTDVRDISDGFDPFEDEKSSQTKHYASMLNNNFATCTCGNAIPHEGLVVDKFYIPIDKYLASIAQW